MPATPVRLSDYTPCPFHIDRTRLTFELDPDGTLVTANLAVRRTGPPDAVLVLDGEELVLEALNLDGRPLSPDRFELTDTALRIPGCPDV